MARACISVLAISFVDMFIADCFFPEMSLAYRFLVAPFFADISFADRLFADRLLVDIFISEVSFPERFLLSSI